MRQRALQHCVSPQSRYAACALGAPSRRTSIEADFDRGSTYTVTAFTEAAASGATTTYITNATLADTNTPADTDTNTPAGSRRSRR